MSILGEFGLDKKKKKKKESDILASFGISNKEEKPFSDQLNSEIGNLETRLRSQEESKEELERDKRNWLERGLNLKEGQNAFFDALEIIDRPADAVRTGIHEYMNGRGFWQGAKEGITGNKDTSGKEVNEILGFNTGNKVGDAVKGFGTEVLLDPLNLLGIGLVDDAVKGTAKGIGKASTKMIDSTDLGRKTRQGVKDYFQNATQHINPNAFRPDEAKDIHSDLESGRNFILGNVMKEINHIVKNEGIDSGTAIQRIMEDKLTASESTKKFLNAIRQMDQFERITARGGRGVAGQMTVGKDLNRLINMVNTAARQTDKHKESIEKVKDVQTRRESKIADVNKEYAFLGGVKGLKRDAEQIAKEHDLDLDSLKNVKQVDKLKLTLDINDTDFNLLRDFVKVNKEITKAKGNKEWISKLNTPLKLEKLGKAGEQVDDITTLQNNVTDALRNYGKDSDNYKQAVEDLKEFRLSNNKSVKVDKTELDNKIKDLISVQNAIRTENLAKGLKEQQIKELPEFINAKNATDEAIHERKKLINNEREELMKEQKQGFTVTRMGGREIEKGLVGKDEFIQNEIGDEIVIPRLKRMLSDKPEHRKIAERLDVLQTNLRTWGVENGINIRKLDGYMRHALNEAYQKARMRVKDGTDEPGVGANKNVVKDRSHLYLGSVEDVNETMGKEFFETNAYKAFVEGQEKVSKYIAAQSFVNKVLANTNLAEKVTDANKFNEVPKGKVPVKLEQFNFYGVLDQNGRSHLAIKPSDVYLVDKGTYEMMKNYDSLAADMNTLYDKFMRFWKGTNLMSSGYHARNILGNGTNRYIAGMNIADQMRYDSKAVKLMTQYNKSIMPKVLNGERLTESQQKVKDIVDDYLKSGLRDTARTRNEFNEFDKSVGSLVSESKGESPFDKMNVLGKAFNKATDINYGIGGGIDDIQRLGMYMWAKNNPKKTSQYADRSNAAAIKVKEAMFDYSDLTKAEQTIMKRVMPFYTFARKNVEFQFRNFIAQPHKYSNLNRAVEATHEASGNDQENLPEFHKEAFNISAGKDKVAKTYLPIADLANFSNPNDGLDQFIAMLSPVAKLPIELAQNRDFFRERQIQEFEGERTDKYLGLAGSPLTAHALDQLGLRNPEKWLTSGVQGGKDLLNMAGLTNFESKEDDKPLMSSLLSNYNPDNVALSKLYDRRKELYDMKKYFEQETGKKLPTLAELEKMLGLGQ